MQNYKVQIKEKKFESVILEVVIEATNEQDALDRANREIGQSELYYAHKATELI